MALPQIASTQKHKLYKQYLIFAIMKFFDIWFGKKNPFFFMPIIILVIVIILGIFGVFDSIIRGQWPTLIALLIFFTIPALFFYFMFRKGITSIIRYNQEQNEKAKEMGIKSTRVDWGLMRESDFYLKNGEYKIKFFPVVWNFDPVRRYADQTVGRISIMVTNKRIMIGPGPLSIYFPKKKKDKEHIWFHSIEKTRVLLLFRSLALWFHVPETKDDVTRFLPTKSVRKRQEEGFVVDMTFLLPDDRDEFIRIIEKAQKS